MKHLTIPGILSLLLFSSTVFGQSILTGTILDKADNEPVIAGSVDLLQRRDSVSIAGAISDTNGKFSIKNVKEGSYILKFTYLGYNTLTKNVSIKANEDLNVGRIFLETNDVLLQEMVVEGKRPDVVVKNDTIEYDAGSYKVTENAAVEELLKKMPGIEVDKDGKITANGKEIKKIMLDGKEFFTDDPQIASKNLPANMVNKVQVVDRKSDMARMTGFDDGEEETILNLMVRPGMKKGTMGNALVGAGADVPASHDLRYQGAAFVNHMKDDDRYTLILGTNNNNNMGAADLGAGRFGGMRMRRGGGNGGGITESNMVMVNMNKQFSPALSLNGDVRYNGSDRSAQNRTEQWVSSQFDKTLTNNNYVSNSAAANFNLEWKPDTLNTLIFRPQFGINGSRSSERDSLYRKKIDQNNVLSDIYDAESQSRTQGRGYNFGGTLDYSHKFHKPGRVFSVNLRGNFNNSYSYENSLTKYHETIDYQNIYDFQRRYENDDRANSYRATVSWVEPLGRNNFLQALYRYSYNDTKSLNTTYDVDYESNPDLYLALLNDSLSRSTVRHSTGQRFGLSFKAVRAKYNYTIGLNIDPQKSINETWQARFNNQSSNYYDDVRLPNFLGDSLVSSIPQDNFYVSPTLNFNYIFSQRTNLRIDYEGETTQPSSNQLRDYVDMSNASNWVKGNPNLQSGYSNSIRARFQKYVPETQLMYNLSLNGGFSFNDITSVTQMQDSVRLTTYDNINGNWNVNTRGMFNLPLKNKKFTVNSFFNASYNNRNSYVYENNEKRTNRQNTLSGMIRANINYRSDLFEVGLGGFTNYNDIANTIRPQNDLTTVSYGFSINTMWYLPYNWTLESDLNYTTRNGFRDGLNRAETMWNAAVTKQLFNKKFGTGSLKLQIFDILQDRNFINSSAIDNGTRISEDLLVIPSYVMCSFIYKFTVFPKASAATEDDFRPRWGGGGGGGRPEGPPPVF